MLLATSGNAAEFTLYLDTDQDLATGCAATTPQATSIDGVEFKVDLSVGAIAPNRVETMMVSECQSGTFGPPAAQPAGFPVGMGNGIDGSDVVEIELALASVGLVGQEIVNVTVVGTAPVSGESVTRLPGLDLASGQLVAPPAAPVAVPILAPVGIALLAIALLLVGLRYAHARSTLAVLLVLVVGTLIAQALQRFIADGQVGDWAGYSPATTLPAGSGSPLTEVRQVFVAVEDPSLFARLDVTETIDPAGQTQANVERLEINGANSVQGGHLVRLKSTFIVNGQADGTKQITWSQAGGPDVTFDPNGPDLVFTAPSVQTDTSFIFFAETTNGDILFVSGWELTVTPPGITFINQVNTGQSPVKAGTQTSHTAQQVSPGAKVHLTSLATGTGGTPVSYAWQQVSGATVSLTDANKQTTTFQAPNSGGQLVFKVTATDPNTGNSATQIQTVDVKSSGQAGGQPPLQPQQGTSHQVYNGHGPIALTANTIGGIAPLTYKWEQTAGPTAAIDSTTAGTVNVTPPAVTTDTNFAWRVTVTDQNGKVAVVTHQVEVKGQPALKAEIIRPNGCQLSCLVEEGDKVYPQVHVTGGTGKYNYIWSSQNPAVILNNPNSATPSFTVPNVSSETSIFLEVSVNDGFKTVTDSTSFTAKPVLQLTAHQNQPGSNLPTGPSTGTPFNNQVESGKPFHPQVDILTPPLTGGATLGYQWEVVFPQPVPPGLVIAGANTPNPIVGTPSVATNTPIELKATITYTSGSKVITKEANSQFTVVPITAPNRPPLSLSMAGHATVYSGHTVSPRVSVMNAAGPLSYQWTQLSGPAVTISGDTTATPSLVAPAVTGHQEILIEVEVGDGAGVATSQMAISVDPVVAPPKPQLTVTASPDGSTIAGSTVQPRATVLHSFGSLGYSWSEITATGVVILSANTATPSFVAPATASTITLQVQVTDSQNGSATDTVTYHVQPALQVTAGQPDRSASEGDRVDLLASVQNAAGAVSFAWTVVDDGGTGVDTGDISNADMQQANLTLPAVTGDQTIKLQVTATDGVSTASAMTTLHIQDRHMYVDLGADHDLTAKQDATLHANVSGGLAPYSYAWTEDARAPLDKTSPANPSLTAPSPSHTVQLDYSVQVTDALGNIAVDSIALRVQAVPIVVSAGNDFIVRELTTGVQLQATVQNGSSPTYQWTQTKGDSVTLSNAAIANPTFDAPDQAASTNQDLEFEVEVSSDGQVKTDRVTVTVQGEPDLAVQVTNTLEVVEGTQVSLPGHVIGAGATVTQLQWTQLSPTAPRPPLSNAVVVGNNTDLTAVFTAPAFGTVNQYVFEFKATGTGNVDTGQTVVNVIETPAVSASVNAGGTHRVRSGSTVTLQATGHSLQGYSWTQVGGVPNVALANADTATPSFTAPDVTADTMLTFEVAATPLGGGVALTDTVDVFVYEPAIVVNNLSATSISLTEGDQAKDIPVVFTDNATPPTSLVPATITWVISPTPPPGVFSGTSTDTLTVDPIASSRGTYHLEVIAGDSAGHYQAGRKQFAVVISAPVTPPSPPLVVDAGNDFIVQEGTAGVQLQATVQNGNSPTYQWTQTKGASVNLSNAAIANPTFNAPTLGAGTNEALEFKVTVASNGESRSDLVAVTVQGQPDLAVQTIQTLEVVEGSLVKLPGHVIDTDPNSPATISRLEWTQVSPASPGIVLTNSAINGNNTDLAAIFTAPAFGTANQYVFEFKATGTGNVDTGLTVVNVIETPAVSASVNAGGTHRVRSGSTVTLQATGHSLQGYSWTQVGGAPVVTLANADTATPSFSAPDVSIDTTLLFRVEATPQGGGSLLNDEVDVVVYKPTIVVNNTGSTRLNANEGDPAQDLAVSFTANDGSGPVAPTTITWLTTPTPPAGLLTGTDTATLTINPVAGSRGTYNLTIIAGDNLNHYQSGLKQFTLTVTNRPPPPLPSVADLTASLVKDNPNVTTSLTAGGDFVLHAPTISGGVGPYKYSWSSTSTPSVAYVGNSGSTDNPTVRLPATPTEDCKYYAGDITMTVTDAAGQTATATLPWRVTSGSFGEPPQCHLCRGPKFICERSHAATTCTDELDPITGKVLHKAAERQFCVNEVENLRDGSRYVVRSCKTAEQVNALYLRDTVGKKDCMASDFTPTYDVQNLVDSHFICNFACKGNNCNVETVPTTLANPAPEQLFATARDVTQCATTTRLTSIPANP